MPFDDNLPSGTIVGRFTRLVVSLESTRELPAVGTLFITPTVGNIRYDSLDKLTLVETIQCHLNNNGELCGPGTEVPGVKVLASDQPLGVPSRVLYRAVFNFKKVRANPSPIVFEVPASGTVDLTTIIPIKADYGTIQVLTDPDTKQDVATLDTDVAILLLDDDSEVHDAIVTLVGTASANPYSSGTGYGIQFNQTGASATWTINHNLGFKPSVSVFNTGSQQVGAEVVHTSVNQVLIYFNTPTAGFARLT